MLLGVTSDVTAKEGSSGSPRVVRAVRGTREGARRGLDPTDVSEGRRTSVSFSLDFTTDTLVLSRREQIPRELPRRDDVDGGPEAARFAGVSLRRRGGGAVDQRLEAQDRRADIVVFDSGTTGMLVDRDLFYGSDLSLGTFECHMKMRAEDGSRVRIGSSLRTCTSRCLFLTLPIDVPWDGVRRGRPTSSSRAWRSCSTGSLTVDADARRVRLGGGFKGAAFL